MPINLVLQRGEYYLEGAEPAHNAQDQRDRQLAVFTAYRVALRALVA